MTGREELRLLYQITASDLAFFKSQQWAVANYTLLVLAALIGVQQLMKSEAYSGERWMLSASAVAVAGAGLYLLSKLEKSISVRHSRLETIRGTFTRGFEFAWAAEGKKDEQVSVVRVLYGAIAGAGALATWLILVRL